MKNWYCVLDFEATCWTDPTMKSQTEIIEFPSVLICHDTHRNTCEIIGEFHGFASNLTDEGILKMTSLLQRISGQFHLVNSHPNNWSQYRIIQGIPIPDVIEFTFIHRGLASDYLRDEYSKDSKSQLNSPCNPDKSEYLF